MRLLKILLILTGATLYSGCSTTVKVHVPLGIPSQCNFEKFTEAEKTQMIESTGKKIFRNQENCRIRQERINDIITAHNETHKS